MTRRRLKEKKPTGFNRSLGNQLLNDQARRLKKHKIRNSRTNKSLGPDNQESNIVNVDSVTDETGLEEFLAKVELADANFAANREEVRIIEENVKQSTMVVSTYSADEIKTRFADRLKIPRRPPRDSYETAEELTKMENENFLKWRAGLAELQESNGVMLTPFERNLQLWRQLWRVIERSDIVVQIVDARNPLLFRNLDLEVYVKECDSKKQVICLVNKSDLLTEEQISIWREYFIENHVDAVFWTSLEEDDRITKEVAHLDEENQTSSSTTSNDSMSSEQETKSADIESDGKCPFFHNPADLINYFKSRGCTSSKHSVVIGMVGYPNVGKSSTINRLLGCKKVSVSATPGKTRHLQTHLFDSEITFCDCPGLVMPSFALGNGEMLLNGILSIDHSRECLSSVQLLVSRVPREYLENLYSVMLADFLDKHGHLDAHTVLTAIAFVRGYTADRGGVDCSRAARTVLKDVVSGRLKWVAAPPNVDQSEFDKYTYWSNCIGAKENAKQCNIVKQLEKRKLIEREETALMKIDEEFFGVQRDVVHVRGNRMGFDSKNQEASASTKKHYNRNKRKKLRKIYVD